ncbi:helix-turn-helix domain-containing protein [Lacinutrix sp. Hel_I_90]|uniref:helix-turn-helix domain-containing protein n=1 Tax=Lacinutrix sp. Hel_I_90 TaxID=1249999 RepID=UPI0005CB0F9A|nr:helix-turn-helix domain-containing protein [Lacinutrix sp. Hel_I_90]
MKIKFIFLLVFIFFKYSAYSQEINSPIEDSIKKYIYSKPKKAIVFSKKYLQQNLETGDTEKIKLAYSLLAVCNEVTNQSDSVLYYYHKRLSLAEHPLDIINNKFYLARTYDNSYNYNEALQLYSQALDLAKKENNDAHISHLRLSIELLKMKLGLNKDGISTGAFNYLKESYSAQKGDRTGSFVRYNRKRLIEVYLHKNEIDKAEPLIKEGLEVALQSENMLFLYYMFEFRSRSHFLKGDLAKAKLDALEAKRYATKLTNNAFLNEINYRLSDISSKENNYEEALSYLKAILKKDANKPAHQAAKYYKLIADIYKRIDSTKLSYKFYYKYIEEKEKATQEYLVAIASIHDITLKEQLSDVQSMHEEELREEILKKEEQKKTKWAWTGISGVLLLLIILLFFFFKNKSKVNQKRFDDLMIKINAFEARKGEENKLKLTKVAIQDPILEEQDIEQPKFVEKNVVKDINYKLHEEDTDTINTIDVKKVEEILIKIQKLEEKQYFLRQDCTLHNMAKKLKTNTSYLSKIINTHLDKSFSIYINELRINYAIIELKNNKRLRSYSIKGIAEEMGYKSADAFSRYFRAATGITPYVYIKKIQEI